MKINVVSFFVTALALTGCGSTESVNKATETVVTESALETVVKKVTRCTKSMSPPVLNKQKIQDMLIKSGRIDPQATQEIIDQQVRQYIANKQQTFAKKCR